MRPLYSPAISSALPRKQRGAALMVMLVIMVIGAVTILVSSLNSSTIQISRQETTSAALAQAKDALISLAVTYNDYPGSLPCPDTNNDGEADAGGTTGCPQYIGRLPWKTLGLPDLRDATGERLWYTLSRNVRRYIAVRPLNSDTEGTLNITGSVAANNLYAIVFAPGNTLAGQNRSTSQTSLCSTTGTTIVASYCASNYLEGSNANKSTEANPVTGVNPNPNYLANLASSTFNDQLIFITKQQLFSTVEKRIGREAKVCLDNYGVTHSGKYPWAVPVSSPTVGELSTGRNGILFGRFATLNPTIVDSMLTKFALLQVAINNFVASNTSTNYTAMVNTASQAESSADAVDSYYNSGDPERDAARAMADAARVIFDLSITASAATISAAQQALTTTINNFNNVLSTPWSNCTLFTSSYWSDWKNLVFYQIANGFKPAGSGLCTGGGNCLSVQGSGHSNTGSGNYRAAIIVAGEKLGPGARTTSNLDEYLELANRLPQNDATKPYMTYRSSDEVFPSNNDLVLCVDGKVNCL